jgi:hypothetical protein
MDGVTESNRIRLGLRTVPVLRTRYIPWVVYDPVQNTYLIALHVSL